MAFQNIKNCVSSGKTATINYSSFPTAIIGNSVLFKDECWEIIDVSESTTSSVPNALYPDCYECYVSNNAVLGLESCFKDFGNPTFSITDFGFVPQLGEVYYLTFVSPITNGLIKSCFTVKGIRNGSGVPVSVLIEPPVLETNCTTCFTGNSQSYLVKRCDGTIDYISLLDDSYNKHTITYTVGLDRYCGTVETQQNGVITGVFVSDYSSSNSGEICQSCNDSVNDRRLLTNCLNGNVEVVWGSPFFEDGNFSHLSSKDGCFSIGPITAATVTLNNILNFDPQPTCQDCIQCNGNGLVLEPCGGGATYNVGSYQYASIGDVIYDPYSGTCSTVINYWSFDPTSGGEVYRFYSFVTGGTSCGTCGSIETPISYYAEECITGNIVVVTFDSTSTIGIGDIVKAKWGTSDFLCYTITSLYDNSLGFDFYYSDTTTSFTGCTECETSGYLGVTLVNCNTLVESYVNVDIPTWVTMAGYDDNLGSNVVKGTDGECYYLVNSCPISPIYDTFQASGEYYYYCFQCTPANSSSCKCYYGVGTPESIVEGSYIDCSTSGQTKTFYSDNGLIRFCGNLLDGNNVLDSGKFCEGNGCPDFCCECYTITNNNASKLYVQYLDCDYNLTSLEVESNSGSTFCGLNVQYLTLGNFTPTVPNGVITTIDVCVNGQCLASLSTSEQLLYKINTKFGPCPSNCCGKNASAGAYLLKNNGNTPRTYSIR